MKKKILVVAAHPDDEVLGVGGTLLRHKKAGDKLAILILANGEDSRGAAVADAGKRLRQARTAAGQLGAELFLENFPDNAFDSVPLLEIARRVEKAVSAFCPDTVYTHSSCDLNVDHRWAFMAALTACRPQPGCPVKNIFAFETLSSTEWRERTGCAVFRPARYHDITGLIDEKIKILKIYRDELRRYPHPRSAEGVRVLAAFRGMEVGLPFAEAFEVIRTIK